MTGQNSPEVLSALAAPVLALAAVGAAVAAIPWLAAALVAAATASACGQIWLRWRQLRCREQRWRDWAEVATDWRWEVDAAHAYTFLSERHREITGRAAERQLGQSRWDALAALGVSEVDIRRQRVDADARRPLACEHEYLDADGNRRVAHTAGRPFYDSAGRFAGYRGIGREITDRRQVEDELRQDAAVFDNMAEAVVIADGEHRIARVNRVFCEVFGYSEEEAIGRRDDLLRSGQHDAAFYARLDRAIAESGYWRGETQDRRRDGSLIYVWQCVTAVRDAGGHITHYVWVLLDISEIKNNQQRLEHQAHHDPLTDLPNRLLGEIRLEQALARAERNESRVAVLFLDLDGFKKLNDRHGHPAGDILLRDASERLRTRVRQADTVVRIAGDEFLLVLDEIADAAAAMRVAHEITACLAAPGGDPDLAAEFEAATPVRAARGSIVLTASVGVSLYPDDAADPATLTKRADAAMYRAKAAGGNRCCRHAQEGAAAAGS